MFPNSSIFKIIAIISCKIYKVPQEHLIQTLLRSFKITVKGEINLAKIIIFRMEEIHKEVWFDKVQMEYNKIQIS